MKNTIEVELKFLLTTKEKHRLLADSQYIDSYEFTDVYYDAKNYSLSCNDTWLRSRNGKFMLKIPIETTCEALKQQSNSPKREIIEEDRIRKELSLPNNNSLEQDLFEANILPLYTFKNYRQSYQKEGFHIDLDSALFDDFTYETCEIEMSVERSPCRIRHAASRGSNIWRCAAHGSERIARPVPRRAGGRCNFPLAQHSSLRGWRCGAPLALTT